jgi:hypothetical protein
LLRKVGAAYFDHQWPNLNLTVAWFDGGPDLTTPPDLLKRSHAHGKIAAFMDRSTAMDIALWIIAIVATLYLIVRLGLAWMVPDQYRGK